jgi:hypothetical protein
MSTVDITVWCSQFYSSESHRSPNQIATGGRMSSGGPGKNIFVTIQNMCSILYVFWEQHCGMRATLWYDQRGLELEGPFCITKNPAALSRIYLCPNMAPNQIHWNKANTQLGLAASGFGKFYRNISFIFGKRFWQRPFSWLSSRVVLILHGVGCYQDIGTQAKKIEIHRN